MNKRATAWGRNIGPLLSAASVSVFLLIWDIATRYEWVSPVILPHPGEVLDSAVQMLSQGYRHVALWQHIAISLERALTAFAAVEKLDINQRTVLYRVAHEALNNVARHAEASLVEVSIEKLPESVSMKIKDNGKAFDVESALRANHGKRLGLLGMRERLEMIGGNLSIESAPGKGTTVWARIPSGKARALRRTKSY